MPFPTGAFDVVLAPHMLYHVPDRPAAAQELRRVLSPGGRCLVVTNGRDHLAGEAVQREIDLNGAFVDSGVTGILVCR